MATARDDELIKLTTACADDAEVLALSVIRMVAAGYSTGDVGCWDLAYAGAERVLRADTAGRLVASLTSLLRCLRSERKAEWHFLPTPCCRVTGDEMRVLHLIATGRGGEPQSVARAALDVVAADPTWRLQMAAQTAGLILDEVADELVATTLNPPNMAVRVH